MRRSTPGSLHILLLILVAASAAAAHAQPRRERTLPSSVSARLRVLARRAQERRGWMPLRRYAAATRSPEHRGLAYFTLGYREYAAGEADMAARDFRNSAATRCSLEDFATYYEALADDQMNRAADGIAALSGFADRYPRSVYRLPASNLLASLLIKAGEPRQSLAELKQEPSALARPASLLLAAQAEEALSDDAAAARTYQTAYYSFPAAPEAREAATALDRLQVRMGSSYPRPSLQAQGERALKLFDAGLYQESLSQYDNLLRDHAASASAGRWRLGRARCLIQMRQYSQAVAALSQPSPGDPGIDAKRLALEARAYELQGDQPRLLRTLDEIYQKYPQSPSYGDALAFAAGFFARMGNWREAAPYYAQLAQDFPRSRYAVEGAWRVAWYTVLAGNLATAHAQLVDFLKRYPHSSRAAAALYWLAEVERRQTEVSAANRTDRFLAERFVNTYYGLMAQRKLRSAGIHFAAEADASIALQPVPDLLIPPRPAPPLAACGETSPDGSLRPYLALDALSLDSLGEQYLADVVELRPHDARLLFGVANLRSLSGHPASAIFAAGRAAPHYDEYEFAALPAKLWKILYPQPYWRLVRRDARSNRLDPYLVMGLIRQESAFNPHATSATHARGLMQMEPYTAARRARGRRRRRIVRELYNPAYNIRVSTRYLREIVASFDGNLPAALASYNAGDTRVRQWIANSKIQDPDQFLETIPFTDTRAYVVQVLRDGMIYRNILTGRARFSRCR